MGGGSPRPGPGGWPPLALCFAFFFAAFPVPASGQPSPEAPYLAARLKILSAAMISHHVFRVRAHQDFPMGLPVTVTVPFPGVPGGASVTREVPARAPGIQVFDFELDSLRVPRFTHTLRLTIRAEAGRPLAARDDETVVIPLPVVMIHGISPTAAFWGGRPETGFDALECDLRRMSRESWGRAAAYRRYRPDRGPERQDGYPTLFSFRWPSNEVSLEAGSALLQEFVLLQLRPATWADRAVLIGWSRGGNLSRDFLSRYAAGDGAHPYAGAALLVCMPATGSPVPVLWEQYLSWLKVRPAAWNDVLPTYPWWRERAGPPGNPVPFVERDPENEVLERLNARERPAKVPVEVLYGTRTVRDTLIGVTAGGTPEESPEEFGDFAVSRFSAQGLNIRINPADPREVTVVSQARWLQGVPAKEFVFERRFRKPGVLHVSLLRQPIVATYIFEWLQRYPPLTLRPERPGE